MQPLSLPRIRPRPGLRAAAFVDTETTGFSPPYDEVVELAVLLFAFRKETGEIAGVLDEYTGLRQPARPIPPGARRVHGISDDDVRGRDLDHARVAGLLHEADFLVAHNAGFDRRFLAVLYPETRRRVWLCSMSGVDWRGKGFPSRGLQELLRAHGIQPRQSHRGLADAEAALLLLSRPNLDGRPYFAELLAGYRAPASSAG